MNPALARAVFEAALARKLTDGPRSKAQRELDRLVAQIKAERPVDLRLLTKEEGRKCGH